MSQIINKKGLLVTKYYLQPSTEFFFLEVNLDDYSNLNQVLSKNFINQNNIANCYFVTPTTNMSLFEKINHILSLGTKFRNEEAIFLMKGIYNQSIEKYRDDFFHVIIVPVSLQIELRNEFFESPTSDTLSFYHLKVLGNTLFRTYKTISYNEKISDIRFYEFMKKN